MAVNREDPVRRINRLSPLPSCTLTFVDISDASAQTVALNARADDVRATGTQGGVDGLTELAQFLQQQRVNRRKACRQGRQPCEGSSR